MTDQDIRPRVEELFRAARSGQVSRRELVKRAAALGVGGSMLGSLLAAGASAAPQRQELAEEQVVRLPEKEPNYFDPGVTPGGFGLEQLQNLFEGLVGIDQTSGEIEMLMAEKMEPNADATEFTFTVRDGMQWSDGTPLNAHDFEYSWKRVLLPETRSEYTSALFPVAGAEAFVKGTGTIEDVAVTAVDDKTLRVGLIGPTPYFPLLAATWTFFPVPRHAVEEYGDQWVEAGSMVSNGPYVLTDWQHDQSMVLEQNANYWGTKPTITRAEYTLFADPVAQALVPFENDELAQAQVPGTDLERVQGDPDLSQVLQFFPRSGTYFLSVDTTNAPTSDVKVRQALSMAMSRDTLANTILKGEFSPAPTLLPPDIPGYLPEASLGEDVEQAKALLAEAGFPDGEGFPELSVVFDSLATNRSHAEYLQGVWNENLGIDVKLEPMEAQAFRDWRLARQEQPYHIYLSSWGSDWGDPANWHNQLFESAADFYFTHWVNEEFDTLVDEARGMTDAAARLAQYQEAERIINRDLPVIPQYHLNRIFVIKPYVKGIYHYPILGRTFLKYISIEAH